MEEMKSDRIGIENPICAFLDCFSGETFLLTTTPPEPKVRPERQCVLPWLQPASNPGRAVNRPPLALGRVPTWRGILSLTRA